MADTSRTDRVSSLPPRDRAAARAQAAAVPKTAAKKRAKAKVAAEKKPAKVSLEDAAREALRVLSALPAVSEKELGGAAAGLAEALGKA